MGGIGRDHSNVPAPQQTTKIIKRKDTVARVAVSFSSSDLYNNINPLVTNPPYLVYMEKNSI